MKMKHEKMDFGDLTFEQIYQGFAKQVLAIYQADYLQQNFELFPTIDQSEVQREKACSVYDAGLFFKQIQKIGIPEHLLSLHLQPQIENNISNL
jgi:hypothetical protein